MPLFSSGSWLLTQKFIFNLPIKIFLISNPKFLKTVYSYGGMRSSSEEPPTRERLASFLGTCHDIEFLRRIHAYILTYGLGSNIFLGSKLLNCYASFGNLNESRWVFDRIINRTLSLWNSIIVGYYRAGQFGEVLKLYSDLKQHGIGLGSLALTFSLKSSTHLETVELARGIHLDSFKLGLNKDRFVGSSLIGFYFRFGNIVNAERVFEEISERDVVVYTAMITEYAQINDIYASEAFKIASYMQTEGFDPNRVTLVSLLQAAGQVKALAKGCSIHAYAIRRGMDYYDEIFETSLIEMYNKCGDPTSAGSIFSRTETKSVASCNSMIAYLVQCGRAFEGLELLPLMERENLKPDLITIANTLRGCADLKCLRQGKSIHSYITRRDTSMDLVAITALIDMYLKCSRVNIAKELFKRMKTKDVISYNVIIGGYPHLGLANEAFEQFGRMIEEGIRPNTATMLAVLAACDDLMDIRKGRWAHGCIVRYGFNSDLEVSNQLLHMYAECGQLDSARKVFSEIRGKDLVSWTSMMDGYIHHGHTDEAIKLFPIMLEARLSPDPVTLLSLLRAFSQLGCLKQVKEIHGYFQRTLPDRDLSIVNSLISTYSKCGRLDISKALFCNMSKRDLTSWNAMIAAYGMHGNCTEVLGLFHQMQAENVDPNDVTFTSLLSACSHAGLVHVGHRIFHSMKAEHFITPGEEHYACMIDLLGRAGQLEEANDLINYLPCGQSISSLSSLLAACRAYRNIKLGELIGRKILELEPENSGVYSLMANIYAEAGKWSQVERIKEMAKERGLKKLPGFSLIESNQQVCGM